MVTFKHENSSVRIHTLFYGAISLMQMYLSDSMVTCVKEMCTVDFLDKKLTLVHKGVRLSEFIGAKAVKECCGETRAIY